VLPRLLKLEHSIDSNYNILLQTNRRTDGWTDRRTDRQCLKYGVHVTRVAKVTKTTTETETTTTTDCNRQTDRQRDNTLSLSTFRRQLKRFYCTSHITSTPSTFEVTLRSTRYKNYWYILTNFAYKGDKRSGFWCKKLLLGTSIRSIKTQQIYRKIKCISQKMDGQLGRVSKCENIYKYHVSERVLPVRIISSASKVTTLYKCIIIISLSSSLLLLLLLQTERQ